MLKSDKMTRYNFKVINFDIMIPGSNERINIPTGFIDEITITKDYDDSFFPLMGVDLRLSPKIYKGIQKNKTEVEFRIRLQCNELDSLTGDIVSTQDVFNEKFIIFLKDEKPFIDEGLYDKTQDNSSTNFNPGDFKLKKTLYLHKQSDLDKSKGVVNLVAGNLNLSDILCTILGENNIKTLLSPLDNTGNIGEVRIPPMTVLEVFDFIENQFGMYEHGCMKFFDHRCLYLLNKNGHSNCFEQGEYKRTIINIKPSDQGSATSPGLFNDKENKQYHLYANAHNVNMQNQSIMNNQISGNTITLVDPKNNISRTINGGGKQRGKGNTQILVDNFNNEYKRKEFMNSIAEDNKKISIILMDINMDSLTPNKEFLLNFEDNQVKREYSGFYRLTKSTFVFTKDGESLRMTAFNDMVKKEQVNMQTTENNKTVASSLTVPGISGLKLPILK